MLDEKIQAIKNEGLKEIRENHQCMIADIPQDMEAEVKKEQLDPSTVMHFLALNKEFKREINIMSQLCFDF